MNRIEPVKDLYKFDQYYIKSMGLPYMFQLVIKNFPVNSAVQVIIPVQEYASEEATGTCFVIGQNYPVTIKTYLFR